MSSRPSIDEYYIDMLDLVASRSTCVRRQVAAILVSESGKLISAGYNGVPSGMVHCTSTPCLGAADKSGDNSRCFAIHAEQNAIIQAGDKISQATKLYCSTTPCFNCAKLLISSGIKIIICKTVYPDKMGIMILTQAKVSIFCWNQGLHAVYPLPQRMLDDALDDDAS